MDDRAVLGRAGEKQAERFLRRMGYRLVSRNYQCPFGELDLVVLDGRVIVFVEVKTRSGDEHADPRDSVNIGKQRRLTLAAQCFLKLTDSQGRACRFDVVTIIRRGPGKLEVEHFKNAFAPVW